jgi:hypothetical protein
VSGQLTLSQVLIAQLRGDQGMSVSQVCDYLGISYPEYLLAFAGLLEVVELAPTPAEAGR